MLGLASGVSAISSKAELAGGCAIKDGGAWCWDTPGPVLVAVSGLESGVTAISSDGINTCAVKDSGAWCWQRGTSEALAVAGAGAVVVSGFESGVSAISATSGTQVCAVKDGGVWCWGDNSYGQLGNNSPADSLVPVAVVFPP